MTIEKIQILYSSYEEWNDRKHEMLKDYDESAVTAHLKTGNIRVIYVRGKEKIK